MSAAAALHLRQTPVRSRLQATLVIATHDSRWRLFGAAMARRASISVNNFAGGRTPFPCRGATQIRPLAASLTCAAAHVWLASVTLLLVSHQIITGF
jgi:hypothetical protein